MSQDENRLNQASATDATRQGQACPPACQQLTKTTRKRRSRAKQLAAWEEQEFQNNGPYAQNIREIELRYPTLTPQQRRVCACIKLMMTSWQIAERLCVEERSVEQYRHRISKRLNLPKGQHLASLLADL